MPRAAALAAATGAAALAIFVLVLQYQWLTYLAVLGSLAIAVALGYATRRGPFAGANGVVMLLMSAGFIVGLTPTGHPIYGVNPTEQSQLLVLAGMGALITGVVVAYRARPIGAGGHASNEPPPAGIFLCPARDRVARLIVSAAILCALLNYVTGEIPILAADVNSARFGSETAGIFDQFWPILFPILQVAVILAAIDWKISKVGGGKVWRTLGCAALLLLILSGSRSIILIPLAAAAFLWIEVKRPSLVKIAVGTLIALLTVGVLGTFRSQQSPIAGPTGSGGLVGQTKASVELALQTGPRVWMRAESTVGRGGTGGALFYGDLANFVDPSIERSDRAVTRIIGRDPVVIGGAPPTVWGGLVLDFGFWGVVVGGFGLGVVLSMSATALYRRRTVGSAVWFAYIATYVMLSTYSYVSLRPSWIIVGMFCLFALRGGGDRHENLDGLEISEVYGRS